MNRRFRAGELSLHEVANNLAPIGNVDRVFSPEGPVPPSGQGNEPAGVTPQHRAPVGSTTSPEGIASESRSAPPSKLAPEGPLAKDSASIADAPSGDDYYRRRAFDALHTYIWNACGNDFNVAQPIFNRVVSALEMNLDRKVQAEQGNR